MLLWLPSRLRPAVCAMPPASPRPHVPPHALPCAPVTRHATLPCSQVSYFETYRQTWLEARQVKEARARHLARLKAQQAEAAAEAEEAHNNGFGGRGGGPGGQLPTVQQDACLAPAGTERHGAASNGGSGARRLVHAEVSSDASSGQCCAMLGALRRARHSHEGGGAARRQPPDAYTPSRPLLCST